MTKEINKSKEVVEKTDIEKRREEYEGLKKENDNVEEELLRREQLKAKIAEGGRSEGGQEQMTPLEEQNKQAEEAAKEIVDAFN